jgi:hypothetical protein
VLARILPSYRPGELVTRTDAVRKLVREDVLALEMATSGWPGARVGVLNVGFLKTETGKAAALSQVQRDYFLPRTEEMVKAGDAASWSFMRLRFPRAEANPYDIVSFGGYASMAQMEAADSKVPEAFRAKEREVSVLLNAARTRVRNQLWIFVVGTR